MIEGKTGPLATVDDNDAVIFFNYRIDRPRQLTMAFTILDFEKLKSFNFGYSQEMGKFEGEIKMDQTFQRDKVVKNLFFVTMTEYHKNIPVSGVAFPPQIITKSLPQVLSESGLKQLHMAESEKERFVTYYFDGMLEKAFQGEEWSIVPSPKVPTYDKRPEMSVKRLVDEFIRQLNKDKFHFIVINFANPDMVAHTGNIKATVKGLEEMDKQLARLVSTVLANNGTVYITADHGNCEEMLTFPSSTFFITTQEGTMNTDHSNNPVPLLVITNSKKGKDNNLNKGALCDVASTILAQMGINKPQEMNGMNLLSLDGSQKSEAGSQ